MRSYSEKVYASPLGVEPSMIMLNIAHIQNPAQNAAPAQHGGQTGGQHALQTFQPLDGRMERHRRPETPKVIRPETPRGRPRENTKSKKSPQLADIAAVAQAWAEEQPTKTNAAKTVAHHLTAAAGRLRPDQLTAVIPAALVERWKKQLSHASAYLYRATLRRLLRHIERLTPTADLLTNLPRIRKPPAREVIATDQETADLIANAPPWLRLFLYLARDLGLRFAEAASIAPANYDPDTQTITYTKKGGNLNTLPITEPIAHLISIAQQTADPTTPYIALLRGKPTTRHTINREWAQLKKLANTRKEIHIHDLRRTFAETAYEKTKDIRAVSQALGHESLANTATYLKHRDPEKLRALIEAARFQTRKPQ